MVQFSVFLIARMNARKTHQVPHGHLVCTQDRLAQILFQCLKNFYGTKIGTADEYGICRRAVGCSCQPVGSSSGLVEYLGVQSQTFESDDLEAAVFQEYFS